jgi:hypothetical protein
MANKDAVILQQQYELRKMEVANQAAAISKWNGVGPTTVTGGQGAIFNIPLK